MLANRREFDENKCLLPGILLKLVDVGWVSGCGYRYRYRYRCRFGGRKTSGGCNFKGKYKGTLKQSKLCSEVPYALALKSAPRFFLPPNAEVAHLHFFPVHSNS